MLLEAEKSDLINEIRESGILILQKTTMKGERMKTLTIDLETYSPVDIGKVLRFEEQKIDEGQKIIRIFCSPTVHPLRTDTFSGTFQSYSLKNGRGSLNTTSGMWRWKSS